MHGYPAILESQSWAPKTFFHADYTGLVRVRWRDGSLANSICGQHEVEYGCYVSHVSASIASTFVWIKCAGHFKVAALGSRFILLMPQRGYEPNVSREVLGCRSAPI